MPLRLSLKVIYVHVLVQCLCNTIIIRGAMPLLELYTGISKNNRLPLNDINLFMLDFSG